MVTVTHTFVQLQCNKFNKQQMQTKFAYLLF